MAINGGNSSLNDNPIANDEKLHKVLYHGTHSDNEESIKAKGLLPSRSDGESYGKVYLTTNKEFASHFAKEYSRLDHPDGRNTSSPVVVHVDRNHPSVRNLKADPELSGKGRPHSFLTRRAIHPDAIKKIERVEE